VTFIVGTVFIAFEVYVYLTGYFEARVRQHHVQNMNKLLNSQAHIPNTKTKCGPAQASIALQTITGNLADAGVLMVHEASGEYVLYLKSVSPREKKRLVQSFVTQGGPVNLMYDPTNGTKSAGMDLVAGKIAVNSFKGVNH
jgi:hypothetical protein